jgi:putative ABC transport system substrate-binding protein
MYSAGDPVAVGLVASLARPGGNVTGNSLLGPESNAKRLSLLRELMPAVQRVGELEPSANPIFRRLRNDLEQAYRSLGVQPIFVEVARASELEDAVANVARQRAQVLHVPNDDLFVDNRIAIMRAAMRYGLPTIVDRYELLEAGGLLYYSFSDAPLRRRGAAFIDKILRGAKPADLPVEQVTQFELGINLKTANALGVSVPQSLLLRADQVIR